MNTSWRYWFGALVAFCTGLWLLWLSSGASIQTQPFPDGSTIKFEGASFGDEPFIKGNVIDRILYSVVPDRGWSIFNFRIRRPAAINGFQGRLNFWFSVHHSTKSRAQIENLLYGMIAEDTHSNRASPALVLSQGGGPNVFELLVSFPPFAPNSKKVRLTLNTDRFGVSQSRPIEFNVSNPTPAK